MKSAQPAERNLAVIKWLTFLMFMMFAMTTDAVGVIIPQVIKEFHLNMTVAGSFQYATMSGIAFAGFFLGYLADKLGRKKAIILGLVLFALNSYLFAVGSSFLFFLALLTISGMAIGIFKTGALALIGDITRSTTEHTATMNAVEGFFAVGAIIGPAIVAHFLAIGASWKWLYVIAGTICVILIVTASSVTYPQSTRSVGSVDLKRTMAMMGNRYALSFSGVIFLYVAVESAVYVWMPTLLSGVSRIGDFCSCVRYFDLLCASRSRAVPGFVDACKIELGPCGSPIQSRDTCLFRVEHDPRNLDGGFPTSLIRLVHVGSLSDDQLQRDQLLPQA